MPVFPTPSPSPDAARPGRLAGLRRILVAYFQALGALVTLGLLALLLFGLSNALLAGGRSRGPVVLELDLREPPPEQRAAGALSELLGREGLTLREVVDVLDAAGRDERVLGVVARLGGRSGGLARAQELRAAVAGFRAAGKPALAYSTSFGEYSPGNGGYYIATAFDEIILQPSGGLGLNGLAFESRFLRGALDKLGIDPQVEGREEFKSARDRLTETGYTEAHREALQTLLDAQFEQMVDGIAEGRSLEAGALRATIDRGPFTASEALALGLVDRLAYRDELEGIMEARLGENDAAWLKAEAWFEALPRDRLPHAEGPVIAWVQGDGPIALGKNGIDPLSGARSIGSDSLGAALRAAADDEAVRAILLRIESPGGSYVASDAIWRETVRAREAGKPLVVSMGNVAGSGGYYIAMDADWIVARPGSVTGSIGVLAGKLVTRELFEEKLGISFDRLQSSQNGGFYSSQRAYTPAEAARNAAWLDQAYADFTRKVARGRDLPPAQVQDIARGRVWSGQDALRLGLVDELGGLPEALAKAKALAGIEADAPVDLRAYPRERGLLAALLFEEDGEPEAAALLEALRALRSLAAELGLGGEPAGMFSMPEVPLVP